MDAVFECFRYECLNQEKELDWSSKKLLLWRLTSIYFPFYHIKQIYRDSQINSLCCPTIALLSLRPVFVLLSSDCENEAEYMHF